MTYADPDRALSQLLESLTDCAVFLLDIEGRVATWNAGAKALKGYDRHEIIGESFTRFYTPQALAVGHPERELAVAASMGRYEEQGWRVRKDGSLFWAHVLLVPIVGDDGELRGYGKIVRDCTQQKQAAEQAENTVRLLDLAANTDYLTSLPSRRALDRELSRLLSSARSQDRCLCLAMLDLDHFKSFNDEHGHQAGDAYLKQAARVWRGAVRPSDFVARYGGEEFVVLLPGTCLYDAGKVLNRLRMVTPAPLTCSIGLAEWAAGEAPGALISRADRALFQAKRAGRNGVVASGRGE